MSLVERDELLDLLSGLLADVMRGQGRTALVGGAAAVGKSALLEAFAAEAAKASARTLVAAASASEQHIPLGVMDQLLQDAPLTAEERVQTDRLLSARSERPTRAPPAPGGSPHHSIPVHDTARTLSARQSLVIVVDDAHACRPGVPACLSYLVRRSYATAHIMAMLQPLRAGTVPPRRDSGGVTAPARHTTVSGSALLTATVSGHDPVPAGRRNRRADRHRLPRDQRRQPVVPRGPLVRTTSPPRAAPPLEPARSSFSRPRGGRGIRAMRCVVPAPGRPSDPGSGAGTRGTRCARRGRPAAGRRCRERRRILKELTAAGLLGRRPYFRHRRRDSPCSETWISPAGGTAPGGRGADYEEGAPATVVAEHLVAAPFVAAPWALGVLEQAAELALSEGLTERAVHYLKLACRACRDERRLARLRTALVRAEWRVNPGRAGPAPRRPRRVTAPGPPAGRRRPGAGQGAAVARAVRGRAKRAHQTRPGR